MESDYQQLIKAHARALIINFKAQKAANKAQEDLEACSAALENELYRRHKAGEPMPAIDTK